MCQVKLVEDSCLKIRPYCFRTFKNCLTQILLGTFLNAWSQLTEKSETRRFCIDRARSILPPIKSLSKAYVSFELLSQPAINVLFQQYISILCIFVPKYVPGISFHWNISTFESFKSTKSLNSTSAISLKITFHKKY